MDFRNSSPSTATRTGDAESGCMRHSKLKGLFDENLYSAFGRFPSRPGILAHGIEFRSEPDRAGFSDGRERYAEP